MKWITVFTLLFLISIIPAQAQSISSYLPNKIHENKKYLFYLHGGVVQEQGIHAVSRYYGAYKYLDILDTLKSYGFNVISEARPKGTEEEKYAEKVSMQIDTLLNLNVAPEHISVVGASLGAYITIETSYKLKNSHIKYAILGLCSDYALDYFTKYKGKLYGNFLSIYERTDEKRSCESIFADRPLETKFREIELNTGIGHAFLYKLFREWVLPLIDWINNPGYN